MTRAWRYALASAPGTSHVAGGTPCQDACACEVVLGADGADVVIAVAADGAGSAPLSEVGARIACEAVVVAIRTHLAAATPGTIDRDTAVGIIDQARAAVVAHAEREGRAPRDLACTLLCAVVGIDTAACFQIGDGVIVASRREERDDFGWLFWPERGEYANTTAFLTDELWRDHLQHDHGPNSFDEVAVLTDGLQALVLDYKNRAAHSPFFTQMFAPLRCDDGDGPRPALSEALARYLASPRVNARTDDDKTLVLASRRTP